MHLVVSPATPPPFANVSLSAPLELNRSFSLIGMVGFSFSIVTCWTALGGTLIVGITSGGPPVMVWSWLGICLLSLAVAYSFAEMCSAFPTAGGQYSWVAILAPPKYARGAAFVTGWFMCTGIVAMGAVNNFVCQLPHSSRALSLSLTHCLTLRSKDRCQFHPWHGQPQ